MSLFVRQNNKGGIIINSSDTNIGIREDIVIDGFQYDALLRVQSHFHTDHTIDMHKSKLDHEIVMSHATRDILSSNENSQDIKVRPGIIGIDQNKIFKFNDFEILLIHNAHVLGSCQVAVTYNGYSIGYSGDFNKPTDHINVDHLVIDGSVAGIFRQRKYSRDQSIDELIKLISDKITSKPIIIKAHSGLLEKIYFWISDIFYNVPRIGDYKFIDSLNIHSEYNYGQVSNIFGKSTKDGKSFLKSGSPYIRFVRQKEDVFNIEEKIVINCTRLGDNDEQPLVQSTKNFNSYNLSLSDHADINATMEYIEQVNPSLISADAIRMGNSPITKKLLNLINCELGIDITYLDIIENERF